MDGLAPIAGLATVCYMEEITHRTLRNESADVLRRVAAGETLVVTNHGVPAATIGPPPLDPLADLQAKGQVRPPLAPPSTLTSIQRSVPSRPSDEIIEDSRGRW